MPQVFKVGAYLVYFWTNENEPLEPIHIHITSGTPTKNDTKVWITQSGHCLLCHNKTGLPSHTLRRIMDVVDARHEEVVEKWIEYFGEIRFYC